MRTLNERAAEILCDLLKQPNQRLLNHRSVQTKVTGRIGKFNIVSFVWHIEIKGVRYRDPEIIIGHDTRERQFIPYHYMNDFFGVEQCYAKPTADDMILYDKFGQYNLASLTNRLLLQTASNLVIR